MDALSGRPHSDMDKFKRNAWLIKGFMVLIIGFQAMNYVNTHIIDLGELAGLFAILFFLRGLLLTPLLIVAPIETYRINSNLISLQTKLHFVASLLLLIVYTF